MFQKSTEKTNPNRTKFHISINRKQKINLSMCFRSLQIKQYIFRYILTINFIFDSSSLPRGDTNTSF